uniref:hypothetical protein n=1 Tax=uncultured Actinomyces sp. TaxID=249061 RepID=UPI00262DA631
EVLCIPFALAVAEQHQFVGHAPILSPFFRMCQDVCHASSISHAFATKSTMISPYRVPAQQPFSTIPLISPHE